MARRTNSWCSDLSVTDMDSHIVGSFPHKLRTFTVRWYFHPNPLWRVTVAVILRNLIICSFVECLRSGYLPTVTNRQHPSSYLPLVTQFMSTSLCDRVLTLPVDTFITMWPEWGAQVGLGVAEKGNCLSVFFIVRVFGFVRSNENLHH